jgi:hypothetical protein
MLKPFFQIAFGMGLDERNERIRFLGVSLHTAVNNASRK